MEKARQKRKASVLQDKAGSKVTALHIERVIGLSPSNNHTVSYCPGKSDILCYPAGPFAVVYSSSTRQQLHLLRSTTSNRALNCACWSTTGETIAAGETGGEAAVLIWTVSTEKLVHELKAHKHCVAALCFSPDGKTLASVGAAHDGQLCLWDWQAGSLLWKQGLGSGLTTAAFTEDSSHLLAVGKGMFKAWSITAHPQQQLRTKAAQGSNSSISLVARPVTLKDLRNSSFVDVCMAPCQHAQPHGSNGVYALVNTGILVLMRPTGRVIDKSVNLQVPAAFGLAASPTQVAAACAQGVVRVFSSKTLAFRATLPRFVARGSELEVAAGAAEDVVFPDARGCSFSPDSEQQLVVAYADQSIIVWNIRDPHKITCVLRLAAHSGCVWDVSPLNTAVLLKSGQQQPSRAATCAADGTIRFWNLAVDAAAGSAGGRLLAGAATAQGLDGLQQLRCMRISSDCRHICTGDLQGTLRVFDSVTLGLVVVQEAHDSEVLCLDYSPISTDGACLAASGSRDTLIHLYDVNHGYTLVETLDDHSAAVTAVRFTGAGRGIVSCGADRTIIFRLLGTGANGSSVAYHIETLPHSLLYDLALDPLEQYVFSTGQDGLLRQWDIATGALQRTLTCEAGAGEPIKLCIDPGGIVLICCHADGCLRLYNLASGQLMCRAWGHSDMVASATVSPDLTRLVSVGGDGCVIVWKLPEQLVQEIRAAVTHVAAAKQHLTGSQQDQQQQSDQQTAAEPRQRLAWSAAPPGPPSAAAPQPLSPRDQAVLQPAHHAAAAAFTTPAAAHSVSDGLLDSGSTVNSTLQRLNQGKPLVSSDKLPRWARSPSSPSSPTSSKPDEQQLQHEHPLGKWFVGRQQAQDKWQLSKDTTRDGVEGQPVAVKTDNAGITRSLSPNSTTTQGAPSRMVAAQEPDCASRLSGSTGHQQTEEWPGWSQEDNMVLIRDWDASMSASFETKTTVLPEAAEGADRLPSTPETPHTTKPGGPDVVRDLFRQHFSSLGGETTVQLARRQHRQSLSAVFKAGRNSLGVVVPFSSNQPDHILTGTPRSGSGSRELSIRVLEGHLATLLPVSSSARDTFAAPQHDDTTGQPPLDQLHAVVGSEEQQIVGQQIQKRWRHGKMDEELADMRQRLANLHALYQQQLLQRQASPRRARASGNSSDGVSNVDSQQQQLARDAAFVAKRSRVADAAAGANAAPAAGTLSTSNSSSKARSPHGNNSSSRDGTSRLLGRSTSATKQSGSTVRASLPTRSKSQKAVVSPGAAWLLPPKTAPRTSLIRVPGKQTARSAAVSPKGYSLGSAQHSDDALAPLDNSLLATALPAKISAAEKPEDIAMADFHHSTEVSQMEPGSHKQAANGRHTAMRAEAVTGDSGNSRGWLADLESLPVRLPQASEAVSATPAAADTNNLVRQLLEQSPEASPNLSSSGDFEGPAASTAAKLAKLKRGVRPMSFTDVVDTSASPASSQNSRGTVDNEGDSPVPMNRSAPQQTGQESMYRVSIGTSIAACAGPAAHVLTASTEATSKEHGLGSLRQRHSAHSASISSLTAPGTDLLAVEQAAPVAGDSQHIDNAAGANGQQLLSAAAAVEGATVTPHGQHTVWPGWGGIENWDGLTPPSSTNGRATLADASQAATNAAADVIGHGAEAKYWLQQNPCYDMTPAGSTPGSVYASNNGALPFAADSTTVLVEQADTMQPAGSHTEQGDTAQPAPAASQPDRSQQLSKTALSSSNSVNSSPRSGQASPQGSKSSVTTGSPGSRLIGSRSGPSSPTRISQAPAESCNSPTQELTGQQLGSDHRHQQQQQPGSKQQPSEAWRAIKQPLAQQEPEKAVTAQPAITNSLPCHEQQQLSAAQHIQHQTPRKLLADKLERSQCVSDTPQQRHAQQMMQQPQVQANSAEIEPLSGTGSSVLSPTDISPMSSGYFSLQLLPSGDTLSPHNTSSTKNKSRAQLKREKAAAKAAAKAAVAADRSSSDGGMFTGSPGTTMLSLLQRIKRTMPSIKPKSSSCSGKASTVSDVEGPQESNPMQADCSDGAFAKPDKDVTPVGAGSGGGVVGVDTLGGWAKASLHEQQQQQGITGDARQPGDQAAGHISSISLDDINVEMQRRDGEQQQQRELPGNLHDIAAAATSGMHAVTSASGKQLDLNSREKCRPQQHSAGATAAATIPNNGQIDGSAGKRNTAAQVAETVERFRHCMQDMQELWLQLQSSSLDAQEATELLPLLTPPYQASAGSPTASRSSLSQQQQRDRTAVTATPVLTGTPVQRATSSGRQQLAVELADLVKQRLQDELLSSIWDLLATVTGLSDGQTTTGVGCHSGASSPIKTTLQPWLLQQLATHSQQQPENIASAAVGIAGTPPSIRHLHFAGAASPDSDVHSPASPAWSVLSPGGAPKEVLEEVTSRICEQYTDILLKKLNQERKQLCSPSRGGNVRLHKHSQQHEQQQHRTQ